MTDLDHVKDTKAIIELIIATGGVMGDLSVQLNRIEHRLIELREREGREIPALDLESAIRRSGTPRPCLSALPGPDWAGYHSWLARNYPAGGTL